MREKNAEAIESYYEELALRLRLEGFTVTRPDDRKLHVALGDTPICDVHEDGIRYSRGDIASSLQEEAKDHVLNLSRQVREYTTAFQAAPFLKAESLEEGYKVLIDYHDTVLAAKPSQYGMQFVTWDWDFHHRGLNHGHYHNTDYENAKRDFAARAGLVERYPAFNQKQMVEIYRCCEDTLCDTYEMTDEQRNIIRSVQETIRDKYPNILDLIREHDNIYAEAMFSAPKDPELEEETEIDIMWDDLKPATQKRILNMLGENGNYDIYPFATIQSEQAMGQTMEQTM